MLRYIISDCETDNTVPLEKEIQLVKDYIELEKVRYGDRLKFSMEIDNQGGQQNIVPLLLLPFIENAFKHGASVMRGKQWVNMQIKTTPGVVDFSLKNSKPTISKIHEKHGIGLKNVTKRLDLLYQNRYRLEISPSENEFAVHMQLQL